MYVSHRLFRQAKSARVYGDKILEKEVGLLARHKALYLSSYYYIWPHTTKHVSSQVVLLGRDEAAVLSKRNLPKLFNTNAHIHDFYGFFYACICKYTGIQHLCVSSYCPHTTIYVSSLFMCLLTDHFFFWQINIKHCFKNPKSPLRIEIATNLFKHSGTCALTLSYIYTRYIVVWGHIYRFVWICV